MPLTTSILFPTQPEAAPKPLFIHRVPLVNHAQNVSMTLDVITSTEAFTDIWREVCRLRELHQLRGFQMNWEAPVEQIFGAPF